MNAYWEGRYIDGCLDAIDEVIAGDDMDGESPLHPIRQYLTDECTECSLKIAEMTPRQWTLHRIYDPAAAAPIHSNGYVLIGCEGYWLINPEVVGCEEYVNTWEDWTEAGE